MKQAGASPRGSPLSTSEWLLFIIRFSSRRPVLNPPRVRLSFSILLYRWSSPFTRCAAPFCRRPRHASAPQPPLPARQPRQHPRSPLPLARSLARQRRGARGLVQGENAVGAERRRWLVTTDGNIKASCAFASVSWPHSLMVSFV